MLESNNMSGEDYDYYTPDAKQFHIFLKELISQRRVRVRRVSIRGTWYHLVSFLDTEGNLVAESCGSINNMDVLLGKWDELFVRWSEKVDDHHTRIRLMTYDKLPDEFPEFKDANLGFNDNDHFHAWDVVMNNEDITDEFI